MVGQPCFDFALLGAGRNPVSCCAAVEFLCFDRYERLSMALFFISLFSDFVSFRYELQHVAADLLVLQGRTFVVHVGVPYVIVTDDGYTELFLLPGVGQESGAGRIVAAPERPDPGVPGAGQRHTPVV